MAIGWFVFWSLMVALTCFALIHHEVILVVMFCSLWGVIIQNIGGRS